MNTNDERDWKLIIKLEAVEYKNPTNALNDICNELSGFDYIHNIELICAEPLIYNDENDAVEFYDDFSGGIWNQKRRNIE